MRVRHLTDYEIQGLLDRRGLAVMTNVSGAVCLKDLEAQEHLDNCTDCQGQLSFYRELYGELIELPTEILPKNFARDVTFSLPPFRAQRTKARLRLAAIWSSVIVVALGYYLTQVEWSVWAVNLVGVGWALWNVVDVLAGMVITLIPLALVQLPALIPPAPPLLESVVAAFTSKTGSVHFVFLAALALIMIASLDRIFISGQLDQNSQDS